MAEQPIFPAVFSKALELIDAAHALDPRPSTSPAPSPTPNNTPYELHYATRCTHYLLQRHPSPSPELQLAIRASHFRRWEVPRSSFPEGKIGYLNWRTHLKKLQASQVRDICLSAGSTSYQADHVARLVAKEGVTSKGSRDGAESEAQIVEDVACLVFLEDGLEEFGRGNNDHLSEEKLLNIIRKTWGKMSEKGHELALKIEMGERAKELVGRALAG
jgi:hypothetical protein